MPITTATSASKSRSVTFSPAHSPRRRSYDWDEDRRRALRRLNAHLTGIEVLTFDQILARADVMIGHLAASLEIEDQSLAPDPEPMGTNSEYDIDELPF